MKYKLIDQITKEEHICDKITIDGFDYYFAEDMIKEGEFFLMEGEMIENCSLLTNEWCNSKQPKIFATNNPNINMPKIFEEAEMLSEKVIANFEYREDEDVKYARKKWSDGYKVAKYLYPFDENDMIEFALFYTDYIINSKEKDIRTRKGIFELWKEQKQITLFYA